MKTWAMMYQPSGEAPENFQKKPVDDFDIDALIWCYAINDLTFENVGISTGKPSSHSQPI